MRLSTEVLQVESPVPPALAAWTMARLPQPGEKFSCAVQRPTITKHTIKTKRFMFWDRFCSTSSRRLDVPLELHLLYRGNHMTNAIAYPRQISLIDETLRQGFIKFAKIKTGRPTMIKSDTRRRYLLQFFLSFTHETFIKSNAFCSFCYAGSKLRLFAYKLISRCS